MLPKQETLDTVISQIDMLIKHMGKPILVALDGRSGTGKSTIAKKIASAFNGVEINSDNFWAGGSNEEWDKKTPQEKADQAISWKRLRREVLEVLLAGHVANWHTFDWVKGEGLSPVLITTQPSPLIVLDGVYSTRPELLDIIDLTIFVEVSDDNIRRQRLISRENEDYMKDWHSRWDVAEDYYFSNVRPRDKFDLVINND